MNQNVDLVWCLPDSQDKGLMKSLHHVTGIQWERGGFLINAELYYKHTWGKQWLYAEIYRVNRQNRIQYVDRTGQEMNKGLDLLVQFRHSRWYHQLAWSLSKSEEQITGINSGDFFPSLNDHKHQLQWTELFSYHGWAASASWIYRTGQPRILPSSDPTSLEFERLPFFSQLDAGFGKNIRFKHFDMSGGMSLLNILNRLNVVQVDYLNISTSTSSFNVRSNISTMSFTPVFYLRFRAF
jgi:hypothetical protein